VITGTQSHSQEDFAGGILADDMGAGKTLVVLSTVASSLDVALDYANMKPDTPFDIVKDEIRAKTTLVIVPSACKRQTFEAWRSSNVF
jgi:SWI/SNF-related matrix-associated actin-dependent regulator of chromatin subfamily A3